MRRLHRSLERAQRQRRARHQRAARRIAAALVVGAAGLTAQSASADWTLGKGTGSYDSTSLASGVPLDIDGDSNVDFYLHGISGGYGGPLNQIHVNPQVVNSVNDEVFANSGLVTAYASPQAVLAAVTNNDPTELHDGLLWSQGGYTNFETERIVGVRFEIPGGGLNLGYLDLHVVVSGGALQHLDILQTGYAPEPGFGLALGSGMALLGVLRLRSHRPRRY
jgi:hypothetical protein